MRSSCKSDDLYQNFEDEQEKFINMFAKSSSNNAIPIKSDSDYFQREVPYGIVEEEEDDNGGEVGGEKQDENFRSIFNHKREYRRLTENEGEVPKGKEAIFNYFSCLLIEFFKNFQQNHQAQQARQQFLLHRIPVILRIVSLKH